LIALAIIGAARALGTPIATSVNSVISETQNSGGGGSP
jgi:hypothetical protein